MSTLFYRHFQFPIIPFLYITSYFLHTLCVPATIICLWMSSMAWTEKGDLPKNVYDFQDWPEISTSTKSKFNTSCQILSSKVARHCKWFKYIQEFVDGQCNVFLWTGLKSHITKSSIWTSLEFQSRLGATVWEAQSQSLIEYVEPSMFSFGLWHISEKLIYI